MGFMNLVVFRGIFIELPHPEGWDQGYGEVGTRLTEAAHRLGEATPVIASEEE